MCVTVCSLIGMLLPCVCETVCSLINAEDSEEGPEYNFEVKDDKKTVHG